MKKQESGTVLSKEGTVLKDIPDGSTIYTLEDCHVCEKLLDQLDERIKNGELVRIHCNPDGSQEEQENCLIVPDVVIQEGFPAVYDKKGRRQF